MSDYIQTWEMTPTTDTDYYGVFYPSDGYLGVGYASPGEARDFLTALSGFNQATDDQIKGAYVVRVQIERVEES